MKQIKTIYSQRTDKKYFTSLDYDSIDEFLSELIIESKPSITSLFEKIGTISDCHFFEIGKHIGRNFIDSGAHDFLTVISNLEDHFSNNDFHLNEEFFGSIEIEESLAFYTLSVKSQYDIHFIFGIIRGLESYFKVDSFKFDCENEKIIIRKTAF